MEAVGIRHVPNSADGDSMAGIKVGAAPVQCRIERIEQAEVDGLRSLAESRAQVINRVGIGVVHREINTLMQEVRRGDSRVQTVVVGEATEAARVHVAVLTVKTVEHAGGD